MRLTAITKSLQPPGTAMQDYEFILNGEPLGTLMYSARCMEGVEFWHGTRKRKEVFRFEQIEAALRVCIDLTEPPNLNPELLGVKTELGTEKLAALFAWTSTPLCYALCSVFRAPHRTGESIKPALPYARLLCWWHLLILHAYLFLPRCCCCFKFQR